MLIVVFWRTTATWWKFPSRSALVATWAYRYLLADIKINKRSERSETHERYERSEKIDLRGAIVGEEQDLAVLSYVQHESPIPRTTCRGFLCDDWPDH
jgi:hypothetical protein